MRKASRNIKKKQKAPTTTTPKPTTRGRLSYLFNILGGGRRQNQPIVSLTCATCRTREYCKYSKRVTMGGCLLPPPPRFTLFPTGFSPLPPFPLPPPLSFAFSHLFISALHTFFLFFILLIFDAF
mgnify:CR=1 FL=1